MKVKENAVYIYSPNLLDQIDGRTDLKDGEEVKVINLPGAPKCNTMHIRCRAGYITPKAKPRARFGSVSGSQIEP